MPQLPPLAWRQVDMNGHAAQRAELWRHVERSTGHPALVEFAARLIKIGDVPARDITGVARVVNKYTQNYIKYFRERPERWQAAQRTIKWGLGDCDDMSILQAAILRSFNIPVRLKFLRFKLKGVSKAHVYPQARVPFPGVGDPEKWVSLEAVRKTPFGYDPLWHFEDRGLRPTVEYVGDGQPTARRRLRTGRRVAA